MVNIYQFWVILEFIAFFTNFAAIIFTLFVSSCWHHKTKRSLTVPLALIQQFNREGLANDKNQVPNNLARPNPANFDPDEYESDEEEQIGGDDDGANQQR